MKTIETTVLALALSLAALFSAAAAALQAPVAFDAVEMAAPIEPIDTSDNIDGAAARSFANIAATIESGVEYDHVAVQRVQQSVDKVRSAAGLDPVCFSLKLVDAAQSQARYMAKTNSVTTTGEADSTPWDRIRAAGFHAASIGELVGAGYTSADDLVAAWMESESSKSILLGNYTHIGPGYVVDEQQQYVHYWVVDLANSINEECSGIIG